MKLFSVKVFVAAVAIFLLAAPSVTFAQSTGWVLYDNFNSGKIDPTKWDIDNSSAAISVENGLLKFVHDANKPNDSSWLIFKKSPAKIKAVKAKVKIRNDAPGNLRARIGGYLGKTEDNYPVWLSITLRNDYDRVEASATAFTDTTSTANGSTTCSIPRSENQRNYRQLVCFGDLFRPLPIAVQRGCRQANIASADGAGVSAYFRHP